MIATFLIMTLISLIITLFFALSSYNKTKWTGGTVMVCTSYTFWCAICIYIHFKGN